MYVLSNIGASTIINHSSFIHSFIYSFIHPCIHQSILPFIHVCVYRSIDPSIHPFIHVGVHPSIRPSINRTSFIRSIINQTGHALNHSTNRQSFVSISLRNTSPASLWHPFLRALRSFLCVGVCKQWDCNSPH